MRSLLILVFLAALCQFVVAQEDEGIQMNPSMIMLEKPVHFAAPDGSDLSVAPGTYRVEQKEETKLTLVPVGEGADKKPAITIQAVSTDHEETLSGLLALSFPEGEDEHHVVLLLPDGKGLDAIGSYSGVRSRVIRRLSPTTIRQQVVIKPNYVTSDAPTTTAKLDETTVLEEKITPPSAINSKVDLNLSVKLGASSTAGYWNLHTTVRNNGSEGAPLNDGVIIIKWGRAPCATGEYWGGGHVIYGPTGGLYIPPQGVWTRTLDEHNFDSTAKVIYCCLDPDNEIIESDETNNRFQLSIPPIQSHPNYTPPPSEESKPDLVITSVEVVPSTGPPSTEFVVNVTISNIGNVELPLPSNYAYVRITTGIGGVATLETPLPVGATKTIPIPVGRLLPPGTKTATAEVDYVDIVDEVDEQNNEKSYTFVVTEDTKRQKLQVIPPKKKKF